MHVRSIALAFPMLLAVACAKEEQAPPASSATTNAATPVAPAPAASPTPAAAGATPAAAGATAPATPAPAAATPSPATPVAGAGEIAVGQPAPDFTSKDQHGKPVHLAELKGKPVVV